MDKLENEIAYRVKQGMERVSMREFLARYEAIGYRFDRSSDCRSMARHMTGERAGESYPYVNLYPVQADNDLSAWNVNARRDENWEAFKKLRNSIFSVSRGAIVEV